VAVEGAEVETWTAEMARWCRARFDNKHHNNSRRFHTTATINTLKAKMSIYECVYHCSLTGERTYTILRAAIT
jgi:hypothetical protein